MQSHTSIHTHTQSERIIDYITEQGGGEVQEAIAARVFTFGYIAAARVRLRLSLESDIDLVFIAVLGGERFFTLAPRPAVEKF